MAYWEFLLQQEGDRSWLPLEVPTVEILEGRYRVVARSNRVNTPVEVRIIHQADAEPEGQPKPRSQKRTSKTNQDGLIVVLPFTWLQPGLWELRCASDLMAEMMGHAWSHTVQLHVQAKESGSEEDWIHELEQELSTDSASEVAEVPVESEPSVVAASTAPVPVPDPVPETFDIPAAERVITLEEPTPEPVPVSVQMDQDSYTLRQSHPLVLTGTLLPERLPDDADESPTQPAESVRVPSGYIQGLQVWLMNPQTGDVCLDRMIAVNVSALPFTFTCHVDDVESADTHLLIGQLTVVGQENQPLAQQSFTVATDLERLLQAIADDSIFEGWGDLGDLASPFALAEPPDLTLLNLISADQAAIAQGDASFQVTHTEPIPPQIYQPEPNTDESPRRLLDLPNFARADQSPESLDGEEEVEPQSSDAPDAQCEEVRQLTVNEDRDERGAEEDAPDSIPVDAGMNKDAEIGSLQAVPNVTAPHLPDFVATPEMTEWTSTPFAPDAAPQTVPPSATDLEFQALNLQTRFLQRLSALASDAELQDWLRSHYPPADSPATPAESNGHLGNHASPELVAVDLSGDLGDPLSSREFVIDDEEEGDRSADSEAAAPAQSEPTAIPEPLKIPDDQPVPTPQLTLRSQDLIAGQPLQITVTLPNLRPRLSVKLWVQDPQTRELLDGPYWLTTFGPNGHDQLESGLQIMVPFGCVEVQFEAIAVEVATQRASRKTSVHRAVIPPDISASAIDDLGL